MTVVEKALQWAETFVGTVEVPPNSNRGFTIDDIQKVFGYKGVAYCALFAQYVYKRACVSLNIPFPFSGTASSQTLFKWAKEHKCAETDFKNLRYGDIIIWQKYKIWQGHVGVVKSVDFENQCFKTIEGNTSPDTKGSQSNGGGIYERTRYMKQVDFTVDSFWLRGFINVRKLFNLEQIDIEAKPMENIQ